MGYLDNHTVSLNATHNLGDNSKFNTQFYLHNVNGHMQMKVLSDVLLNYNGYSMYGARPLIYSESTFPGSGAYGGTWIGDISV